MTFVANYDVCRLYGLSQYQNIFQYQTHNKTEHCPSTVLDTIQYRTSPMTRHHTRQNMARYYTQYKTEHCPSTVLQTHKTEYHPVLDTIQDRISPCTRHTKKTEDRPVQDKIQDRISLSTRQNTGQNIAQYKTQYKAEYRSGYQSHKAVKFILLITVFSKRTNQIMFNFCLVQVIFYIEVFGNYETKLNKCFVITLIFPQVQNLRLPSVTQPGQKRCRDALF